MNPEAAAKSKLYLTKAVRHYGSLFTLPTCRMLILLLLAVSLIGSTAAFAIALLTSEGILRGILFGIQVLFLPLAGMDLIIRATLTRTNKIFNLRRSVSLSLITSAFYTSTMVGGAFLQTFLKFPSVLFHATLLGICLDVTLRFLVLSTVTYIPRLRLAAAAIAQPAVLFASNMIFWGAWSLQIAGAVFLSSAVLIAATRLLIYMVNRQGELAVGIGAIPLFKGFLANWLEYFTSPLEGYFEKLGTDADVSVNMFAFKGQSKLKATMSIPNIHPGPFRNLGSSDLPDTLQRYLETKFGAIAAVPHGMSGHELDLTSQPQCGRVVKEVLAAELPEFSASASKLIRVNAGLAKATCQILGETALVTVTCAPSSTEDIPLPIGKAIEQKGRELGVEHVSIIDAHNSIDASKEMRFLSEEEENALTSAAELALKGAVKEERQGFMVGVAKVAPSEFEIGQGMGPGGIVALTVFAGGQKALYITIDGNNMISGLREEIIQALSDRFDECEVMTTDTHVVNAVGTMGRGYYAVGEAIDHARLISHIKDAAAEAEKNAEKAEVSFTRIQINNVRVIGEEKLTNLMMLIDQTFRLLRWATPLIYVPALIIAALPLLSVK